MKKGLSILMMIVLCNTGFAKNEVYPGMVRLLTGRHKIYSMNKADLSKNISDTVVFRFYQSPDDKDASRQLSLYFDWSQEPRLEKVVEKDCSWLMPMSYSDASHDDWLNIYFTCKSRKGDWLEIVVNEKTQETRWIKSGRLVKLISWDEMIQQHHGMTVALAPHQKMYSNADTASTAVSYSGVNCFEIRQVKGNWMKIGNSSSEYCGSAEEPSLDKAWIQFRTDEKMIVDIDTRY